MVNNKIRVPDGSGGYKTVGSDANKIDLVAATPYFTSTSVDGALVEIKFLIDNLFGDAVKKGDLVYNVKDYGAKVDGETDDSSALAAAVATCASAGGGVVYIPSGTIIVNQRVTISTGAVTIRGSGKRSTTLRTTGSNIILEYVAGSGECALEDLTLDTTGTAETLLYLNSTIAPHITRVFFSSAASGRMVYSTSSFSEFVDCSFNCGGVNTLGLEIASAADHANIGTRIVGGSFSGPGRGMKVSYDPTRAAPEGLRMTDTGFINTGDYNLFLEQCFFTQVSQCGFDLAHKYAVLIAGADDAIFDNCYFGTGGSPVSDFTNIYAIPSSTNDGSGLSIQNSRLYSVRDFNVAIYSTPTRRVKNVTIANNRMSCLTNNLLLDSVDGITVANNTDVSVAAPTGGAWATLRNNGAGGIYSFQGNRWHSSSPQPALFDAIASYRASPSEPFLRKSGRTVFSNAVTSLTISHGLRDTPDVITMTPEGDVGSWRITARTTTTFTVEWTTAVNGAWYWDATIDR